MKGLLTKILSVAIYLPLIFVNSCNAVEPTVAERCYWVDLHAQKGKLLIPILDAFAEDNDLMPDKSHPINPTYKKLGDGGVEESEVSYLIGVGEFGAQLAIYRFDRSSNAELLSLFDQLLEEKIAPKFKVTQCEVSQFPTAYR